MVGWSWLSLVLVVLVRSGNVVAKYAPEWSSLDSRPLPGWYDEAKVGIFMHFGPYSVPGVESASFWHKTVVNETDSDRRCIKYLKENFPPRFTYQDFAPMLTMEFFNASVIADIVAKSGAKYFVFTSKHHDGFCNWPSSYAFGWNSMAVGPKRDVIRELKNAFQKHRPHVHFGLYYSLFEYFHPIYLKDKASNFTTRNYVLHKMQPELKELITTYTPDILWSDGDWEAPPEYFGSQDFLAWLYNESPVKDTIVTNDRWGRGTRMRHGGFYSGPDRYDPRLLIPHKWENAMTVDALAWSIRRNIRLKDVLDISQLIAKLASAVSCGGNILIDVGPTKEGTIIPVFEERLTQLGMWLRVNGEAIYGSSPWKYQNDSANSNVWYTSKGKVVYAIVLGWPNGDTLQVKAPQATKSRTRITMLGLQDEKLHFKTYNSNLIIAFPSMSRLLKRCGIACTWGHVLKLEYLKNGSA